MLFVDDNKPQTCELHRVLDNGMGAYKDLYGAVEQSFQHFLTSFAFHDTCQEGYAQVHVFQETHHGLQVLFCQDFRRCHDTGLITVVDGNQHRHERYEGLA